MNGRYWSGKIPPNQETLLYELTNKKSHKYQKTKLTKFLNIIFYTLIILMIMVTIDIISVSRYNRGPYFAIKTAALKDGGT